MDNMAHHGHLECMKYALENGCKPFVISYTPSLECLDFAIQNGFDWKTVAANAATHGNLAIMKHAYQSGAELLNSAANAAKEGHVNCLIYAIDKMVHIADVPSAAKTLICFKHVIRHFGWQQGKATAFWFNQVKVGNVEILRLLLERAPIPHVDIARKAILSMATKSVDVLKFMLDEAKVSFDLQDPFTSCAHHGNLEGLKLLFERNLPMKKPSMTLYEAVRSKNLDVVKYVWAKIPNKESINMAQIQLSASSWSTPEILDFLTQHGAHWIGAYLIRVARVGNLPNLAYLWRIGGKYHPHLCLIANMSKGPWSDGVLSVEHRLCVKYAREHGCQDASDF